MNLNFTHYYRYIDFFFPLNANRIQITFRAVIGVGIVAESNIALSAVLVNEKISYVV